MSLSKFCQSFQDTCWSKNKAPTYVDWKYIFYKIRVIKKDDL